VTSGYLKGIYSAVIPSHI